MSNNNMGICPNEDCRKPCAVTTLEQYGMCFTCWLTKRQEARERGDKDPDFNQER